MSNDQTVSKRETPLQQKTEQDPSALAEALSQCLFKEYRMFVGGVGLGAAYGMYYKKGIAPLLVVGVAGTVGDMIYGYTVSCKDQVDAYNNQK